MSHIQTINNIDELVHGFAPIQLLSNFESLKEIKLSGFKKGEMDSQITEHSVLINFSTDIPENILWDKLKLKKVEYNICGMEEWYKTFRTRDVLAYEYINIHNVSELKTISADDIDLNCEFHPIGDLVIDAVSPYSNITVLLFSLRLMKNHEIWDDAVYKTLVLRNKNYNYAMIKNQISYGSFYPIDQYMLKCGDLDLLEKIKNYLENNKNILNDKNFDIAYKHYNSSYYCLPFAYKFLNLFFALESLLNINSRQELTHRISLMTAHLISKKENKIQIYNDVKKLYDLRSRIVHGDYKYTDIPRDDKAYQLFYKMRTLLSICFIHYIGLRKEHTNDEIKEMLENSNLDNNYSVKINDIINKGLNLGFLYTM